MSVADQLTPVDFAIIADVVRNDSAIVLEAGKEYLIQSRLAPLVKEANYGSIANLVRDLRVNRTLRMKVVDAMTTNETSFFRDIRPFDALRNTIVPEIRERRRAERRIDIWCAAASSGQEPVSIAIALLEHFPELATWNVNILATDISAEMLKRCRNLSFSMLEVNRGMPATLIVKYFEKNGNHYVPKPAIRNMIHVREMNLAAPWPPIGPFDVIFIRNVLIYFDRATKSEILRRARSVMHPDGHLFLGGAETTVNIDSSFIPRKTDGTTIYGIK